MTFADAFQITAGTPLTDTFGELLTWYRDVVTNENVACRIRREVRGDDDDENSEAHFDRGMLVVNTADVVGQDPGPPVVLGLEEGSEVGIRDKVLIPIVIGSATTVAVTITERRDRRNGTAEFTFRRELDEQMTTHGNRS